jgi:hypothetical protein
MNEQSKRMIYVLGMMTVLATAFSIASCGKSAPSMEVSKVDSKFVHAVSITSKATEELVVRRAVANNNPGNALCDRAVGKSLTTGRSTTLIFVGCGDIIELTIYTDMGENSYKFN